MSALRFTLKPSGNKKLVGDRKDMPFYATYREVGTTCPSTCPLLNAGCYAQGGNVAIHQRGSVSADDGTVFLKALDRVPHGGVVRLHVSGDVLHNGDKNGSDEVDVAYLDALIHGSTLRPDVSFYGYTHAWRLIDRTRFVFPANFVLNASCDTVDEVREARAAGWDTVTVVPHDTVGKRFGDTVVCPNQTSGMTCATCKLCFKSERKLTVAFKAHGYAKQKVSRNLS